MASPRTQKTKCELAPKKYQPAPGDFAYAYNDTSQPFKYSEPGKSVTRLENENAAITGVQDGFRSIGYKPENALPRWGIGTPIAQRGVGKVYDQPPSPYGPPTAPTPQDIAEMEKAGTADISPRFSPIEMRGSTLNAWQSGSLESPIAKTARWGTMLNDRPGGGRTYESFSKPMGSGTLSQRPTPTAPGASERVAYRRAIRMDPKSTEEDRRFARGIGGARNSSYGNYD